MTQSELLERCVSQRAEVELALRGGVLFRGLASGIEDGQMELEMEGARAFVLVAEIVAVKVFQGSVIRSEADLIERARALEGRVGLELVWREGVASRDELDAAWRMFEVIAEALAALSGDAYMRRVIEERIVKVKLVSMEMGRFCVEDGVLEAGFDLDAPPLPARELQGLLAAIL